MEQYLVLNSGIQLNDSYVLQAGSKLWVYVYDQGISFGELFNALNDPAAVSTVTQYTGGTPQVYEGFTELFCIRKEDGGFMTAGLRRA